MVRVTDSRDRKRVALAVAQLDPIRERAMWLKREKPHEPEQGRRVIHSVRHTLWSSDQVT